MEHTIDAKNRSLGRVATEAAVLLMGKDKQDFARNKVSDVKVVISGVSELNLSEKKKSQKVYKSYSGYPGGLKEKTLGKKLEEDKLEEVVKTAVYGMLPKNKLRSRMIKNLIIKK